MRKTSRRFRPGAADTDQLKGIEKAQTRARQRKIMKKIDSIEKSRQRVKNRFRRIANRDDAEREFGT
jgi:hypothetical protein